ncbi:zf-HC2 domain-containing protein [Kribbella turkmenica]|uniref:Zf-HC2 domain-containing protein n=1 Tax=Kribbella turkmenica TaxID=2530375 RepID=A0A4R4WDD8_9ACTN|nr:zf-HC2 domain-containing protein [Kribbella turkmenica]TDD16988.1 zf-HC2 domain-containing protein [Kribbella turkmenica]
MTCPETTAIGAYVLGALDVEDRRATEQHLTTCDACRETLLQFAHLPGLLHAVPLEDVQEEPEPAPAPPLRPPARRRPRRALLAAAALVIAVTTGLVSWPALDGAPRSSVTWTATDAPAGVDTTATLTSHPWGTDIQLQMSNLRPGQHCKLVVHGSDGTTETAGWWATTTTYQADVPTSTSIPLADIARLEVVGAGDTVLSTVSPTTR